MKQFNGLNGEGPNATAVVYRLTRSFSPNDTWDSLLNGMGTSEYDLPNPGDAFLSAAEWFVGDIRHIVQAWSIILRRTPSMAYCCDSTALQPALLIISPTILPPAGNRTSSSATIRRDPNECGITIRVGSNKCRS